MAKNTRHTTKKTLNVPARTHFLTIWPKALENMGISTNFDDLEQIKKELEDYYANTMPESGHYTAICKSADGKIHIHEVVRIQIKTRFKR